MDVETIKELKEQIEEKDQYIAELNIMLVIKTMNITALEKVITYLQTVLKYK